MASTATILAGNLALVRRRIDTACLRSGREGDAIRLVAVTKYARLDWVRELIGLGVADLGESRPQQLIERAEALGEPVRWHLVGHLQRNKVRKVLPLAACIHSVDSWKLLERIDLLSAELGLRPDVLLEVNVSAEAAKDGFAVDALADGWPQAARCRHVRVAGLMTMAPLQDDPEHARPVFRRLRELRDELSARPPALALPELSMGMSHDFDVAIEEGATMIRVGSDLFAGLAEAGAHGAAR
ncbi:MAG TPA: YggS family pyridoxal phosphate-dependent enzyme [Planctomycetaceae bacterium]|nr:YggS family pyridoxal phosphate-dependent enzyme [Planctomycetaceae bacterium]